MAYGTLNSSVGINMPHEPVYRRKGRGLHIAALFFGLGVVALWMVSSSASPQSFLAPMDAAAEKKSDWCFDCEARCENVREALDTFNSDISPEARRGKYRTLAINIGKFYRGTDHLYLQDIFEAPDDETYKYTSDKTRCFVDADQHINNFGSFQDSRNQVVYDLNDFDEAMIGQYIIDLHRLGASVVMQMDENGLSTTEQQEAVSALGFSYASTLKSLQNNEEQLFQLTKANAFGLLRHFLINVETSDKYTRKAMLDKYTVLVTGKDGSHTRLFNTSREDLSEVSKTVADAIAEKFPRYVATLETHKTYSKDFYNIKHVIANRLGAGVGSTGNTRWYVLLEGPTLSNNDDIILDIKHEPTPSWAPFASKAVTKLNEAAFSSDGQRAALGYRAMNGPYSDALLGWLEMGEPYGSFLVKQRPPCKGALKYGSLKRKQDWLDLSAQWGMVLATNHARGDGDATSVIKYSFENEFSRMMKATGATEKTFAEHLWQQSNRYYQRVVGDFKCFTEWDQARAPNHE